MPDRTIWSIGWAGVMTTSAAVAAIGRGWPYFWGTVACLSVWMVFAPLGYWPYRRLFRPRKPRPLPVGWRWHPVVMSGRLRSGKEAIVLVLDYPGRFVRGPVPDERVWVSVVRVDRPRSWGPILVTPERRQFAVRFPREFETTRRSWPPIRGHYRVCWQTQDGVWLDQFYVGGWGALAGAPRSWPRRTWGRLVKTFRQVNQGFSETVRRA